MAFATPLVNYLWPDAQALNGELMATIDEMRRSSPGIERSNVGGRHTDVNFLRHQGAGVAELSRRAGQRVLFPSWLQHQVYPDFSATPRVSVAFNVLLTAS